jgi:hypothetical protein
MKDWTARIETDRNVLERIAAILLALAVLAERAAGASRPVRCHVLWALRQADDVARAFVAGPPCDGSGDQWPPAATPVRCGFDPADTEYLAASLRMLAFVVQAMAAQASPGGTCGDSLLSFRRNAQPLPGRRGRKKVNCPLRLLRLAGAPPRPPPRRCAYRLPIFQKFNGQTGKTGAWRR